MEAKGFVNIKFIVFLKATLGKMMGTEILPNGFLDLHFWQSWPRKFYNVKAYDGTKLILDNTTQLEIHQENPETTGETPSNVASQEVPEEVVEDTNTQLASDNNYDDDNSQESTSILNNSVNFFN